MFHIIQHRLKLGTLLQTIRNERRNQKHTLPQGLRLRQG